MATDVVVDVAGWEAGLPAVRRSGERQSAAQLVGMGR